MCFRGGGRRRLDKGKEKGKEMKRYLTAVILGRASAFAVTMAKGCYIPFPIFVLPKLGDYCER